jgi:5-methylcytosine-specific restriction endonuclease McrBC regulatory subunit McrC
LDLKHFINELLFQFQSFFDAFLMGWMSSRSNTAGSTTSSNNKKAHLNNINQLPVLNKLGKYRSVHVKKLIADYIGVYYGERLAAARHVGYIITVY